MRQVVSLFVASAVLLSLVCLALLSGGEHSMLRSKLPRSDALPCSTELTRSDALSDVREGSGTWRPGDAVGPIDWPGGPALHSYDAMAELTSLTPPLALASWAAPPVDGAPNHHESRAPTGEDGLPRVILYTVKSGDTVWDIAREYRVSVDTIMGASGLSSAGRIQIGQVLKILTVNGVLHKVETGDTLSGLAAKYKVDEEVIAGANALTPPFVLSLGRDLIVPGARPVIVHRVMVGGRTVTIYGQFLWPVAGRITSSFGWRWGHFHHGVDIGVPQGRSIVASRAGRVIFAGWNGGFGNTVILDHGDGLTTLYAHASSIVVRRGQWVEAGQTIARVGSTGYSTGPHLHFEVRVNGTAINPLLVLQ